MLLAERANRWKDNCSSIEYEHAYHRLEGRHPAVSTGGGWDEVSIDLLRSSEIRQVRGAKSVLGVEGKELVRASRNGD